MRIHVQCMYTCICMHAHVLQRQRQNVKSGGGGAGLGVHEVGGLLLYTFILNTSSIGH